jgi:hypothetical protein
MSASATNRPSHLRAALAALVTVLILAPAGVLFAWVWNDNQDRRDSTKLEQQGVEYLTGLAPLVSGLVEAQTSALRGVTAAPGSLTSAVSQVSAADQRLGDALGTHERWSGLRDKIQHLAGAGGTPMAVYQAHVEVTDLALGLYHTVRDGSGLVRDPDNDLSHLQQALTVDLPGTVV